MTKAKARKSGTTLKKKPVNAKEDKFDRSPRCDDRDPNKDRPLPKKKK